MILMFEVLPSFVLYLSGTSFQLVFHILLVIKMVLLLCLSVEMKMTLSRNLSSLFFAISNEISAVYSLLEGYFVVLAISIVLCG